MLTSEKSALLRSFLASLPQSAAARLAKAVEADRASGGRVLPHELILGALRPALRAQLDRAPTPQRLFCRPFEDLLVEESADQKQRGRIARGSVTAVWNWLSETLLPGDVRDYSQDVERLVQQGRSAESLARAKTFWDAASRKMRDAITNDCAGVRAALKTDAAIADAEEMALLLSAGTEICEIQKLLPRQTPQLTADMLKALHGIHDRLAARIPDAAPYVSVVAMNRLVHPWEALKIPQVITNQTQDTLISGTDMGLVGDVLFADIEMHGNALRAVRHPVFDADEVADHLAHFTELSSHIVREIEVRRGGKWGKRLLADRAAVAEAMEGLMEHASTDIPAAMPVHHSGSYGGGPLCADLSRPVLDGRAERAVRYARLLAGCTHYAAMGSFAAAHQKVMDEASQHLRGYNEDLIRETRAASESERPPGLDRQFELAVELTGLIFSPEEAEHLRRRARAAVSPVAA